MTAAGIRDSAESRELRHSFIRESTAGRAQETRELTAADARLVLRLLSGQATLRISDAGLAQAAGTHGRRGHHDGREQVLAGEQEFVFLGILMGRLGWDKARMDAFVARQLGAGRTIDSIRTVAEANRVAWGLKSMIRRAQ